MYCILYTAEWHFSIYAYIYLLNSPFYVTKYWRAKDVRGCVCHQHWISKRKTHSKLLQYVDVLRAFRAQQTFSHTFLDTHICTIRQQFCHFRLVSNGIDCAIHQYSSSYMKLLQLVFFFFNFMSFLCRCAWIGWTFLVQWNASKVHCTERQVHIVEGSNFNWILLSSIFHFRWFRTIVKYFGQRLSKSQGLLRRNSTSSHNHRSTIANPAFQAALHANTWSNMHEVAARRKYDEDDKKRLQQKRN